MGPVHMSPGEALRARRILGASTSAAIHYGTFRLADDGQTEAVDSLRALVAQSSTPEEFRILEEGFGHDVARMSTPLRTRDDDATASPRGR